MGKVKLICVEDVSYWSKKQNKQVEGTNIIFVDPAEKVNPNQAGMKPHEVYTNEKLFNSLSKKVGQEVELVYDTTYFQGKPQLKLIGVA